MRYARDCFVLFDLSLPKGEGRVRIRRSRASHRFIPSLQSSPLRKWERQMLRLQSFENNVTDSHSRAFAIGPIRISASNVFDLYSIGSRVTESELVGDIDVGGH